MPYTLKKEKFKYKNPQTGQYQGVDVVAEQSFADYQSALQTVGQQQQTAVKNEGTTQKNAVIAAGTAAAANFPATADACDTLAADFADTYVPDQAYAVGEYCTYQYKLYQCKTAIAVNTDHSFVAAHWNEITVTETLNDQVGDLKTQLDGTNEKLDREIAIRQSYVPESDNCDCESEIAKNTEDIIKIHEVIDGSFHLATSEFVDDDGNNLVNNGGDLLEGDQYALIIDNTFTSETAPSSAKAVGDAISNIGSETESAIDEIRDEVAEFESETNEKINEIKIGLPISYPDIVDKMYYNGWRFPVLYLNDVPDNLTSKSATKSDEASNVVKCEFPAYKISEVVLKKLKVQGSSSATFPKKNYTLTFNDPVMIQQNWGYQKKYVIKGNFNEASQLRNICSAKLWGQERRTRINPNADNKLVNGSGDYLVNNNSDNLIGETNKQLSVGINCGAIDGFPIAVFINDTYWGLYCFTIPKDAWMAGMGSGESECILSAEETYNQATWFKHLATMEETQDGHIDFDVEYASDNFSRASILTSLNTAIGAAMETYSTKEECLAALGPYLDIDSAIDYMILCAMINNSDGIGRNYLLQTWDGVKWFFAAYDLDMVFGNDYFNGTVFGTPLGGKTFSVLRYQHRVFELIYTLFQDELVARYNALRSTIFSDANIYLLFGSTEALIPKPAYNYEALVWPETANTSAKDCPYIYEWYRLRANAMDTEIHAMQ